MAVILKTAFFSTSCLSSISDFFPKRPRGRPEEGESGRVVQLSRPRLRRRMADG